MSNNTNSSSSMMQSATDLQADANNQFSCQNYAAALESYTKAIDLLPDNIGSLLSQRSRVYTELKMYENALCDLDEALKYPGDHTERLFHRARVLYSMGRYSDTVDALKLLVPKNASYVKDYKRALERVLEQKYGRYDIIGMYNEAKHQTLPCLDRAEYTGSVKITDIARKGRGVVVTQDVSAGTLLLSSKPYAIVFQYETEESPYSAELIQMRLYEKLSQKLRQNPSTADTLLELCSAASISQPYKPQYMYHQGSRSYISNTLPPGTLVQIPNERIIGIIRANSFHVGDEITNYIEGISGEGSTKMTDGLGIWILPSYINHSCASNAEWFTIGDMLFVRAIQDIVEGGEVTISYSTESAFLPLAERNKTFKSLGFVCICEMCELERNQSEAARYRQLNHIQDIVLMKTKTHYNHEAILRIQSIIRDFTTASTDISSPIHLMGVVMFDPLVKLAANLLTCNEYKTASICVQAAFELLPRRGGILCFRMMRMMQVAGFYFKNGRKKEAKRWMDLLKQDCEIMFGGGVKLWEMLHKQDLINAIS
ncbi:hypothetical protein BC937DRAFT_91074 [Endogone sp. FLAS-F59071]|nr:hypothetical protein BC937DRAFT_91074 [Endogone sp. FLAS-F59071]|eukprot:RUS21907.1 hypothetical protein BC937DRAFT_91074 [Endogone sp. FLAS-F59071]